MNHLNGDYEILGRSPQMQKVVEDAKRVSPYSESVLITGESGTGKQVVARYIHRMSGKKSFVYVSCAVPVDLIESELFGHEKGAFTGATSKKKGRFEYADDGTFFLDDIAYMHRNAQNKLLQAIEYGDFFHVGSNEELHSDARIISATNVNLRGNSNFSQDLYYRLGIVRINIPPLRERPEDIEDVARFYLDKLNKKYCMDKQMEDDVLDVMKQYEFPGNVRELKNIVENAFCMSPGDRLDIGLVESRINQETTHNKEDPAGTEYSFSANGKFSMNAEFSHDIRTGRREFEEHLIRAALIRFESTVRAAKSLCLSRSSLYKKVKELGYLSMDEFYKKNGISRRDEAAWK